MDNMKFWETHHLVAINECVMSIMGTKALVVGKRYDPISVSEDSLEIKSEIDGKHLFPFSNLEKYFVVKTNFQFKEGESVWDSFFFPGVEGAVKKVVDGSNYPLQVNFTELGTRSYTHDGRRTNSYPVTLSKVPYEFKLPEQQLFQKGDPVLCRDNDTSYWKTGRFEKMMGKIFVINHGKLTSSWNQCIPFDLEKMGTV